MGEGGDHVGGAVLDGARHQPSAVVVGGAGLLHPTAARQAPAIDSPTSVVGVVLDAVHSIGFDLAVRRPADPPALAMVRGAVTVAGADSGVQLKVVVRPARKSAPLRPALPMHETR